MGQFSCVLFDLDGTLLNTNDLVVKSFQHTLATKLGLHLEARELYPFFGEPLKTTMGRFAADRVDELLAEYRRFNAIHHDALVTPFAGAYQTMEALESAGILQGVVTSKLKGTASKGLILFNLDKFIKVMICCEDVENHKPHGEPVEAALRKLGIGRRGVLMVGDSPMDIRCAKNAGVASAGVTWSVHQGEILNREQPDFMLDNLEQLKSICGITA